MATLSRGGCRAGGGVTGKLDLARLAPIRVNDDRPLVVSFAEDLTVVHAGRVRHKQRLQPRSLPTQRLPYSACPSCGGGSAAKNQESHTSSPAGTSINIERGPPRPAHRAAAQKGPSPSQKTAENQASSPHASSPSGLSPPPSPHSTPSLSSLSERTTTTGQRGAVRAGRLC